MAPPGPTPEFVTQIFGQLIKQGCYFSGLPGVTDEEINIFLKITVILASSSDTFFVTHPAFLLIVNNTCQNLGIQDSDEETENRKM